MSKELVVRLRAMFPEQEGYVYDDRSYKPITYGTVKQIIAALAAQQSQEPSLDACFAAGKGPEQHPNFNEGGKANTPEERARFEAYMRGHCWEVGGYDEEKQCYDTTLVRMLYGVWRDRGSLYTAPQSGVREGLLVDALRKCRSALHLVCHLPREYDMNSDPDQVTLKTGRAFALADSLLVDDDVKKLNAITRAADQVNAEGCTRSHPHDDMNAECERKTTIARETNSRANAMQAIKEDAPVMKAWNNYKSSDEFKNTRKWALHEEHVDGSLWAAFYAGFFACAVDQVNAEGRAPNVPSQLSGKGDGTPSGSKKETTLNGSAPASSAPQSSQPDTVSAEAGLPEEPDFISEFATHAAGHKAYDIGITPKQINELVRYIDKLQAYAAREEK